MQISKRDQAEFNKLLESALHGNRRDRGALREKAMNESLSTAAMFAGASVPILDEQYKAREAEAVWKKIATLKSLDSFEPQAMRELVAVGSEATRDNGGYVVPEGALPVVPELSPFPRFSYEATGRYATVGKHGIATGFSLEAIINNHWDLVKEFPDTAATMASDTDDAMVLIQLAAEGQLRPDVFSDANRTVLQPYSNLEVVATATPKNAPLGLDALLAARAQVKAYHKRDGHEVSVDGGYVLLVSKALEDTAKAILGVREVEVTSGNTKLKRAIGFSDVELVSSAMWGALAGGKAWALVPKGGKAGRYDVLARTSLSGFEKPDLRIKADTGLSITGGTISPEAGSFDRDSLEFRIRHMTGGALLRYDGIIGSTGAGS